MPGSEVNLANLLLKVAFVVDTVCVVITVLTTLGVVGIRAVIARGPEYSDTAIANNGLTNQRTLSRAGCVICNSGSRGGDNFCFGCGDEDCDGIGQGCGGRCGACERLGYSLNSSDGYGRQSSSLDGERRWDYSRRGRNQRSRRRLCDCEEAGAVRWEDVCPLSHDHSSCALSLFRKKGAVDAHS